jgi:threonine dehydrogenase-like Zn-dependent dehydrogenase
VETVPSVESARGGPALRQERGEVLAIPGSSPAQRQALQLAQERRDVQARPCARGYTGLAVRQLTFVEAGRVEWQEVPDAVVPGPAGAVVRPLAVARCDLDLPMATAGLFPGPFPVGHETVAEVVAVGEQVRDRKPGDRVLVPFQVSCGACAACQNRRFGGCATFRGRVGAAFGFGEAGGGFGGALADFLAVPAVDHLLVPAPSDVSVTALATLPDNVADGYRAVGPPLRERPGADVLIVGGMVKSVTLYAVAAAVATGARRVHYVDSDPRSIAAAAALGADVTEHRGNWPRRFDRALITVDGTGDPAGLAAVLRSTDDYGYCTSVAIYFDPLTPVPLREMYTRGVTFHVSRADSRRLLPEVIGLVAARRLDPLAIPTTVVPWGQAPTAWLEPATKLVLVR